MRLNKKYSNGWSYKCELMFSRTVILVRISSPHFRPQHLSIHMNEAEWEEEVEEDKRRCEEEIKEH